MGLNYKSAQWDPIDTSSVNLGPSTQNIGFVTIAGPVSLVGNVTLSDPKTFIGLVTASIGNAGFSYQTLTSQTTVLVKSGAGVLHTLTMNTPVANSVINLYDNITATGTKIGTITLPATLVNEGPNTGTYDANFTTGLSVQQTGASSDITVTFR